MAGAAKDKELLKILAVSDSGIPPANRYKARLCYCCPLKRFKVEQADIVEASVLHNVACLIAYVLEGLVVFAAIDQQVLVRTNHARVVVASWYGLASTADGHDAHIGSLDARNVWTWQNSWGFSTLVN